jgi:hypothetical protein
MNDTRLAVDAGTFDDCAGKDLAALLGLLLEDSQ